MKNIASKEKKFYKAYVVLLTVVVLLCCLTVGVALAWLDYSLHRETKNNIKIGFVDFEVYNGESKLTSTKESFEDDIRVSADTEIEIEGGSNIRSLNLTVRNTGTISAIIRATISIYYIDEFDNMVTPVIVETTPTKDNEIGIDCPEWVLDFKDGIASGYMFYNSQITPYTITRSFVSTDGTIETRNQEITAAAVPVVSQILVPSSMVGNVYYIKIAIDGVAYAGNIYQQLSEGDGGEIPVEAYPFGSMESLPEDFTAWKRESDFNW